MIGLVAGVAGVYVAGAVVTWVVVGAKQHAELEGPRWAERRAHVERCRVCEPPGWFWTTGYTCKSRSYGSAYPYRLSPWFKFYAAFGWPLMPLAALIGGVERRVAEHFARAEEVKAMAVADAREVERLIREAHL